jgi:hypothetical protein
MYIVISTSTSTICSHPAVGPAVLLVLLEEGLLESVEQASFQDVPPYFRQLGWYQACAGDSCSAQVSHAN